MPLPKAPARPATRLDIDSLPAAKPPRRRRAGSAKGKAGEAAAMTVEAAAVPAGAQAALTRHPDAAQAAPPDGAASHRPASTASATMAHAPTAPTSTASASTASASSGSAVGAPAVRAFVPPSGASAVAMPSPVSHPAAAPTTGPASGASTMAEPPTSAAPTANAATPTSAATRPRRATKRRAADGRRKLFVLDTNVLMHDPTALFRFVDNDVYLPMVTIEELDDHKRGMSEVSRNARQVSRTLDQLIDRGRHDFARGIPLNVLGNNDATGHLFFQTGPLVTNLPAALPEGKADNQILGVTAALRETDRARQVVLVSKDINMRIKAHALGLNAEDYFNDQVSEDTDVMYAGIVQLPADFWERHGKGIESWQQNGATYYRIHGPLVAGLSVNQFVFLDGELPLLAQIRERNGNSAVLQTLKDYSHHKHSVWGITARNREQNCALNLLMNPEIDFVTLLGQAGTGKTLLALAAGLAQTLDHKRFSEIIVTRATVPVGDDIGYLPGTEEEKMQPWMGALEDNLEVLNQGAGGEWARSAAVDLIRSRIRVKAMSFMRGRTFVNKFLIIDEAQNLTPKQMKTLITRAGTGTKVVCMGNVAQIDTPYLTEASSGLTYVVERFKGWAHSGHVALQRGERSRLADFASDAL